MTSNLDISNLLANIRQLREIAVQDNVLPINRFNKTEKSNEADFSKMLSSLLDKVNDIQQKSENLKVAYEQGDPSVDITQVMLASQKSSLAFETLLQVRNKLIDAYKEIMNMAI